MNELRHLRDRIAAALEVADRIGYGTRPYADLADAVIGELERGEKPCGCRPIWKADDE